MSLDEEMQSWAPLMESILGKETWESLTCYQRMCEIVTVKQISKQLDFNLF